MIIILLQGHRMSLSSSIKCHGDEQPRPILYQHPMSSEKLTCTTPISSLPNAAQSLFSFSTHLLLLLSPLLSWYILSTRELINRHCFSQSLLRLHLIFIHIFSTSFSSSPSSSSSSCSYSCFFFFFFFFFYCKIPAHFYTVSVSISLKLACHPLLDKKRLINSRSSLEISYINV